MKALQAARKEKIARVPPRRMKEQRQAVKAIKAQLERAMHRPGGRHGNRHGSDEVLWYVATIKKYGEIAEGQKDDGYYRYRLGRRRRRIAEADPAE